MEFVGYHVKMFRVCLLLCLAGFTVAEERGYVSDDHTSHHQPVSFDNVINWDENKANESENPFTSVVRHTLISTARGCMSHVNATEADLEHLRQDPPFPEKAACIIECLLEKVGIVKNKKYSKTGFMTAITPLVFTHKKKLEHMKTVSENCDNEINHHNVGVCQLGNEVTTCIFKYAPELHLKA